MRAKWKRILSMIVSVSLVVGLVPMSAFAETTESPGTAEVLQTEYANLSTGIKCHKLQESPHCFHCMSLPGFV